MGPAPASHGRSSRPLPGAGAGKAGVCPELKEELNCTQECGSDGECADNLKCCRAGCAAVCLLPNSNAGCPRGGRGAGGGGFREGGRSGTGDPWPSRGGWNQILTPGEQRRRR